MEDVSELLRWLEAHEAERRATTLAREVDESKSILPSNTKKADEVSDASPKKSGRRKRAKATFCKEVKEMRFAEEGGVCQWCRTKIDGKWHAHHILPKSMGGSSEAFNLMVLHAECHMDPDAFRMLHFGMEMPKAFAIPGVIWSND